MRPSFARLRLPKRGALGPAPFGRPARSLRHGDNRQFGKASHYRGRAELCRSAAAPLRGARSAGDFYTAIGAVSGAWCV